MSHIYKELGNRVRYYRKAISLTTSELASRINVSTGQLSNIENGNYDVFKLELLSKLSKELNLSLGELINPNSLDLIDFNFRFEEKKFNLSKSLDESSNNVSYINQYLNTLTIAFLATASEFKNDTSKVKAITNHLIQELHFIKNLNNENQDVSTL